MKKYKIKIKMLVCGFPSTKEQFITDGFELKSKILNEEQIMSEIIKDDFSTNSYIVLSSYKLKDDKNLYYNYFDSVDYFEINVPNDKCKSKSSLTEYIQRSKELAEILQNFEKKLRLIFNIKIIFPICKIFIYDENENFQNFATRYSDFPSNLLPEDIDIETFEKNSHFFIDIKSVINLEKKDSRFNRAFSLFNESFNIIDKSLSYLMLFSSLEALLIKKGEPIQETLAQRVSEILLFESSCDTKRISIRIKKLYDIRSRYIHGQKNNITDDLEKELRNYVRQVLIIYLSFSFFNNYKYKEIIDSLKNKDKINLFVKTQAKYLRATDFKKTYEEMSNEILKEIKKGNAIITEIKNGVVKSVKLK